MATFAKWTGMAALAILTLLGVGPGRADAVINPLFQVPFGVNPYFRVRPGLTLAQAYYNTAAMGQAYAQVPPYAFGYNPYVALYAPPPLPMYSPSAVYSAAPYVGYGGYGNAYVPMTPGYLPPPQADPYMPQGTPVSPTPAHKGIDRLAGLTKADGSLDWPLGLRVLPPAAETEALRQKITTEVLDALDRVEEGKAPRAAVQQASQDIDRLQRILNERAQDVPLTDQAVTDASRFLRNLKNRIKGLPAS